MSRSPCFLCKKYNTFPVLIWEWRLVWFNGEVIFHEVPFCHTCLSRRCLFYGQPRSLLRFIVPIRWNVYDAFNVWRTYRLPAGANLAPLNDSIFAQVYFWWFQTKLFLKLKCIVIAHMFCGPRIFVVLFGVGCSFTRWHKLMAGSLKSPICEKVVSFTCKGHFFLRSHKTRRVYCRIVWSR